MSALTRGLLAAALIAAPFAIADRANATQWGTNYPTTAHPNENLWAGQATVARVFEPARLRTWDDYPELERAYNQGVRRYWISWKGTRGSDKGVIRHRRTGITAAYNLHDGGNDYNGPRNFALEVQRVCGCRLIEARGRKRSRKSLADPGADAVRAAQEQHRVEYEKRLAEKQRRRAEIEATAESERRRREIEELMR